MTGKSLQINIVTDSHSAVKSKRAFDYRQKENCDFLLITKYSRKHYSDVKQHMAEKGPPTPIPKPVRKPPTQAKAKEPSQKNLSKQNPSKAAPPLEPRIVEVPVVLVDQLVRPSPSLSTKPTKSIA